MIVVWYCCKEESPSGDSFTRTPAPWNGILWERRAPQDMRFTRCLGRRQTKRVRQRSAILLQNGFGAVGVQKPDVAITEVVDQFTVLSRGHTARPNDGSAIDVSFVEHPIERRGNGGTKINNDQVAASFSLQLAS